MGFGDDVLGFSKGFDDGYCSGKDGVGSYGEAYHSALFFGLESFQNAVGLGYKGKGGDSDSRDGARL